MKLSQIQVKRSKIPTDSGPDDFFEVRGVNVTDLMTLLNDHAPAMRKIYDMFVQDRKEGQPFNRDEVQKILINAIKEFPDVVLRAVAHAADDPEGYETLRQMPLAVQADALEQVALLSIRSEAELKKFQETMLRLIRGVTTVFTSMTVSTPSIDGSGKSAKT